MTQNVVRLRRPGIGEPGSFDYRMVFDLIAAPVLILDRNYAIVDMNEAWLEATHTVRKPTVGTKLFDSFPETDVRRQQIETALAAAFKGEVSTVESLPYDILVPPKGARHFADGPHPDATMVLRYWDVHHQPMRGEDGVVEYVIQTSRDVTDDVMANDLQRSHNERLRTVLKVAELGTWELDIATNEARCDIKHDKIFGYDEKVLEWTIDTFHSHVHRDDLAAVKASFDTAFLEDDDWNFQCRIIDAKGVEKWIEVFSTAWRRFNGKTAFIGTVEDITERKAAEERTRVISNELDHRVKNILATVVSIARIAGRRAQSVEAFVADFGKRMDSLARNHSALAANRWEGLTLKTIVDAELQPYVDRYSIAIDSPEAPVVLQPAAAQAFGLVIHELLTNAAKYGALSQPSARLEVGWSVERAPKDAATGGGNAEGDESIITKVLRFSWVEQNVSDIEPPSEAGFGSTMINQILAAQFKAEVDFGFRPDGLVCTFAIPLDKVVRL